MKLVVKSIKLSELKQMSERMYGNLVRAVVDIQKKVMVVDASMHADQEKLLLENGSKQEDLWGINFYPEIGINDEDFVEFDSMINIRPRQHNFSRDIESKEIREKVRSVVNKLVT